MPTYEWYCDKTQCPIGVFEIKLTMQQMEEGLIPDCPICGRQAEWKPSHFSGKFGDTERFHDE